MTTFIPKVNEVENLSDIIDNWNKVNSDRTLIFCDEESCNNPKKQFEAKEDK